MKCKNCGAEVKGSAKFCIYCGEPLNGYEYEEENIYENVCPFCGKVLEPGSSFCSGCGASLFESDYAEYEEAAENDVYGVQDKYENNNKYTGKTGSSGGMFKIAAVVLAFAAAVILIIALTAVILTFMNKNKAEGEIAENSELTEEADFPDSEKAESQNNETEEKVEQIRGEYGDIALEITNGTYDEIEISNGIRAYYSGSDLKAVMVSSGTDNSDYIKTYYYSGGSLICAYYEGTDAQRFYFSEGSLLLQRYFPDASYIQSYTDYGAEDNTWAASVLSEAENLKESWQNALVNSGSESETKESESNGSSQTDIYIYNPPAYPPNGAPPDNSGSTSSTSGIESEMSELIYNYCSNLCSAINSGSYSVVSKYIASGSSLETSQRSLISRLYSNGTTEELINCNVTNVVSAGTNTYYVYVTETERINYVSKGTKTNTYNWKYTAVYSGGQWKLSNIEQA